MLKPLSKKQAESITPKSPILCLVRDLVVNETLLVRGLLGKERLDAGRSFYDILHPALVYPRFDNTVVRACRISFLADRWDLRVFEDLGGPPETGNTAFGITPRAFAKTANLIGRIVRSTAEQLGARIAFSIDEPARIIRLEPKGICRQGDQIELSFRTPTKDPEDEDCSMVFRLPYDSIRATYGNGGVLTWVNPGFFKDLPRFGKEQRP